jgi:hypothetical protein
MQSIECPVYECAHKDQLRILLRYGEGFRPIFWFQLAADASLYLGPRYTKVTRLRHSEARRVAPRELRIEYSEGTEIADSRARLHAKVSFHGSGVINAPSGRLFRSPLRSLDGQDLVSFAVFQHPRHFSLVATDSIRKRDVCLDYPIDEGRPLAAYLYAAPKSKLQLVRQPNATFQVNLFFCYPPADNSRDLTLQLILTHGAEGPWPEETYLGIIALPSSPQEEANHGDT